MKKINRFSRNSPVFVRIESVTENPCESNAAEEIIKIIYVRYCRRAHAVGLFRFWPRVKNACQQHHNSVFDTTHKHRLRA